MRRILQISIIALFATMALALPPTASAQFQDLLKDYCSTTSNVQEVIHTDTDTKIYMKKPFLDENRFDPTKTFFKIENIELTNEKTGTTKDIPLNERFPLPAFIGGRLILTPSGATNFIKQETQQSKTSTNFGLKVTQELFYDDVVDKQGKPITSREYKCTLQKQTALTVRPQAQVPPPSPSPAPSSPSPSPRPHFIKYCDSPLTSGTDDGVDTAIGCVPIKDTTAFTTWFLKWAIGIAGGIAFLLMVVASFQIMTASGNPEKLQGGRELLTAAISGLILIIFSVFLLQLIGVKILQIPGLGV